MGSPPQDECSHRVNLVRSREDYPLIGIRWKSSNGWSRGVLTDRGLDLFNVDLLTAVLRVYIEYFLVSLAPWTHSDPIPNSVVKHGSGDDTFGVAHWNNSSMPESIFQLKAPLFIIKKGGF